MRMRLQRACKLRGITFGCMRVYSKLYADDGLVHCRNEQEAQALKTELQARLAECRLEMHPTKTKIVYCKDRRRKGRYRTSPCSRTPRGHSRECQCPYQHWKSCSCRRSALGSPCARLGKTEKRAGRCPKRSSPRTFLSG
jgi:Reverse transcriptase (RNA-dependent DNA polymerase)